MPYPAVIGWRRLSIECADMPANAARAASVRKAARASAVAGSTPEMPYRAAANGARGTPSGDINVSTSG